MDKLKRRGLARLMAYCLARRPDEFGLLPDLAGFIPVKQLSRALSEEPGWGFLRESHLRQTAYGGPFEIDGERIRSTEEGRLTGFFQDMAKGAAPLPATLYHAARRKAYPVILKRGLAGSEGRPVVMSAAPELALKLGRRRDQEPVLIEVRASEAALAGVRITRAGELLYVADSLPPEFLLGPPVEKVAMPRRKPQPPEETGPPELPGSFFPRLTPPPGEPRERGGRHRRDEPGWKRERRRADRRRRGRDEG